MLCSVDDLRNTHSDVHAVNSDKAKIEDALQALLREKSSAHYDFTGVATRMAAYKHRNTARLTVTKALLTVLQEAGEKLLAHF